MKYFPVKKINAFPHKVPLSPKEELADDQIVPEELLVKKSPSLVPQKFCQLNWVNTHTIGWQVGPVKTKKERKEERSIEFSV